MLWRPGFAGWKKSKSANADGLGDGLRAEWARPKVASVPPPRLSRTPKQIKEWVVSLAAAFYCCAKMMDAFVLALSTSIIKKSCISHATVCPPQPEVSTA